MQPFDEPPKRLQLLLRTRDADEATLRIGALLGAHRMTLDRPQNLDARVLGGEVGELRVGRVSYGGAYRIEIEAPREAWTLTRLLDGTARVQGSALDFDKGGCHVFGPGWRGATQGDSRAAYESVQVSQPLMAQVFRDALGTDLVETPVFSAAAPGATALARRMGQLLDSVLEIPAEHGLLTSRLESMAVRAMLLELVLLWPNSYSRYLFDRARAAGAAARALAYMHDHLTEDVTLGALARASGVGVRALEIAFVKAYGSSPMRHLRSLRLDQVRTALQAGRHPSVTDAALHFGFGNAGLFARYYRARHGELPSETMKQAGF